MKGTTSIVSEPGRRVGDRSPARWPVLFVLSAGAILALAGANAVLRGLGRNQALDLADPLLNVPFRCVLVGLGVADLMVAGVCLLTKKQWLGLTLVAWLLMVTAVYRAGLWTMGWEHPWVFVGGLTDAWHISPLSADRMAAGVLIFLLVGAGAALWSERRRAPALNLPKMSCPACGGHIKFARENLGREIPCPHCQKKVTLREPGLLKMTCFFCKEHIEFPAHALGQRISCPHCGKDVRLKESR